VKRPRLGDWALAHPLQAAEALVAVGLFGLACASPALRAIGLAVFTSFGAALRSFVELVRVDTAGTLGCALAAALPALLVGAPWARMLRHGARHRLAWLPFSMFAFLLVLPSSLPAISTPAMWVALLALAALGWWAARRPRLRLLALLPALLCLEPMLGHSPLGDWAWTRARLAARCAANDGRRPLGFSPEQANTRYFGLTPLDDQWLLLTGERASTWLRRSPAGLARAQPSQLRGNLWQGCALDGGLWLTKRGLLAHVERPDGAQPERVTTLALPHPPGLGIELDLVDAVCDPERHTVYVSELLGGGIRVHAADGTLGRRDLGAGINLQLVRRADGALIGIDLSRLLVYDPRADRVLERHGAGLVTMGLDVCASDGTVAIADFAGRLRLFQSAPPGRYRFERGVALRAPRRVAFSPDCRFLAVTSGDDRTVWVLRRADLSVAHRYQVGPGLRDLTYLAGGELALADACTATLLEGRAP